MKKLSLLLTFVCFQVVNISVATADYYSSVLSPSVRFRYRPEFRELKNEFNKGRQISIDQKDLITGLWECVGVKLGILGNPRSPMLTYHKLSNMIEFKSGKTTMIMVKGNDGFSEFASRAKYSSSELNFDEDLSGIYYVNKWISDKSTSTQVRLHQDSDQKLLIRIHEYETDKGMFYKCFKK